MTRSEGTRAGSRAQLCCRASAHGSRALPTELSSAPLLTFKASNSFAPTYILHLLTCYVPLSSAKVALLVCQCGKKGVGISILVPPNYGTLCLLNSDTLSFTCDFLSFFLSFFLSLFLLRKSYFPWAKTHQTLQKCPAPCQIYLIPRSIFLLGGGHNKRLNLKNFKNTYKINSICYSFETFTKL